MHHYSPISPPLNSFLKCQLPISRNNIPWTQLAKDSIHHERVEMTMSGDKAAIMTIMINSSLHARSARHRALESTLPTEGLMNINLCQSWTYANPAPRFSWWPVIINLLAWIWFICSAGFYWGMLISGECGIIVTDCCHFLILVLTGGE